MFRSLGRSVGGSAGDTGGVTGPRRRYRPDGTARPGGEAGRAGGSGSIGVPVRCGSRQGEFDGSSRACRPRRGVSGGANSARLSRTSARRPVGMLGRPGGSQPAAGAGGWLAAPVDQLDRPLVALCRPPVDHRCPDGGCLGGSCPGGGWSAGALGGLGSPWWWAGPKRRDGRPLDPTSGRDVMPLRVSDWLGNTSSTTAARGLSRPGDTDSGEPLLFDRTHQCGAYSYRHIRGGRAAILPHLR